MRTTRKSPDGPSVATDGTGARGAAQPRTAPARSREIVRIGQG